MTFASFKQITDLMVKSSIDLDKSKDLNIDLLDFVEPYHITINFLWGQILTAEGLDWLDWFMYEKGYIQDGIGKSDFNAYDDDTEICKDLEGLYNYLTKNNYFKCANLK
jgi:hypothetical protein